ncbi:MAG TPA: hypothetical protein VLG11_05990 [Candidatus Saccharimonadales bacterium]|nr:hypothetical protein [Candidatus Saccharimonadales bacterium]
MAFENIATGREAYYHDPANPAERVNGFDRPDGIPEDWVRRVTPVSVDLERIDGQPVRLRIVRLGKHTNPTEPLAIVKPAEEDGDEWAPGSLDIAPAHQDSDGLFDISKAIGIISSIAEHMVQDDGSTSRDAAIGVAVDWFANAQLLSAEVETGMPGTLLYELARANTEQ